MNTEPVNPFQSPRAEDPLPSVVGIQPPWRFVLLGLLIAPLARPLFFFASSFFWSIPPGLRTFLIVVGFSYLIALPAIVIAAWLHRRNRLTPLTAFFAWGWIPLVWGLVSYMSVTYKPPGPTAFMRLQNAIIGGLLFESPFIVFALYLAFLRRRDQKWAHEPRA